MRADEIYSRAFFETNILAYLYSNTEPEKKARAKHILEYTSEVFISTQVVNELINVLLRKSKLSHVCIKGIVQEVATSAIITRVDMQTILYALDIAQATKYGYFDSLMIASALMSDCIAFYSEDMHDGQVIEQRLRIVNPFKDV